MWRQNSEWTKIRPKNKDELKMWDYDIIYINDAWKRIKIQIRLILKPSECVREQCR